MTPTNTTTFPARRVLYQLYLALTILGGLAVYVYTGLRLPQDRLGEVLLFAALCGLAQLMPVPLFRNSAMSVAFPICFASLVYLGPEAAVWVNFGCGLVATFRPRRSPLVKALWNLGALALVAGFTGFVYQAAGGAFGPTSLDWAILPPAVVAVTGYFFAQTILLAAVIAMSSNASFSAIWGMNYRWLAPNY